MESIGESDANVVLGAFHEIYLNFQYHSAMIIYHKSMANIHTKLDLRAK